MGYIKIALKIVLDSQMAMKNHERQSLTTLKTHNHIRWRKEGRHTGGRKARNMAAFLLNDLTARQKLKLPQKCSQVFRNPQNMGLFPCVFNEMAAKEFATWMKCKSTFFGQSHPNMILAPQMMAYSL